MYNLWAEDCTVCIEPRCMYIYRIQLSIFVCLIYTASSKADGFARPLSRTKPERARGRHGIGNVRKKRPGSKRSGPYALCKDADTHLPLAQLSAQIGRQIKAGGHENVQQIQNRRDLHFGQISKQHGQHKKAPLEIHIIRIDR